MYVLKANNRRTLSLNDIEFLRSTLAAEQEEAAFVEALIEDEGERDAMLDHPLLAEKILNAPEQLEISAHLFFYILVRKTLLREGLEERNLADYIAAILVDNLKNKPTKSQNFYVTDTLNLLDQASGYEHFYIKVHLANQTLYLTGLFPEHIKRRKNHSAAPGISFYEAVGQENFRTAGNHILAEEHELNDVFRSLGSSFEKARTALNIFSEEMAFWEYDQGLELY